MSFVGKVPHTARKRPIEQFLGWSLCGMLAKFKYMCNNPPFLVAVLTSIPVKVLLPLGVLIVYSRPQCAFLI